MPQLDVRMVAAALEIDSMDRWIATLILMATAAALPAAKDVFEKRPR